MNSACILFVRRLWLLGFALIPMISRSLELPVPDANLKTCITEIAAQRGYQTPAEFTAIQCHNRNIQSASGLEVFTNLTSLSLYNNKLRSLELHQLPKLAVLNIARNDVEHLELRDLPALSKLYFFENRLAKVVLSQLPALQEIKGNHNKMHAFTYAELPRLQKIYLFNNALETIDIHHLPALTYMDVRENPMPDELYEKMDAMPGVMFLHDGNAEDW